ncbi:MAG: N-acetylmuramoyl-L-alanine amidase [Eubacteriales bacterium]|nr:N-acetylmuramoyl-L-alanine amidase [Eubacteriales bacterium]
MSETTIALDAGHGGSDFGATYKGRQEKNDTLRLVQAVGKILEDSGVNIVYTRTNDMYETPFKKATDANNAGADYFISIHRNSSETPNQYSGAETLVYNNAGIKAAMAENINKKLEAVGFKNLGINERPNLVVLKRTQMPAILIEAGFINNDNDNELFDENFQKIAQAIADGILMTLYDQSPGNSRITSVPDSADTENEISYEEERPIPSPLSPVSLENKQPEAYPDLDPYYNTGNPQTPLYRVQVGAFRNKGNADRLLNSLLIEGFPAFIIYEDGLYKVQVGAFRYLANAVKMEHRLRRFRYNTFIVYS